jgi:hypothetical protein
MSSLWDTHTDLSQEYEKSSYWNRHVSGELRGLVSNLETEVQDLLNDTRVSVIHPLIKPKSHPIARPRLEPMLCQWSHRPHLPPHLGTREESQQTLAPPAGSGARPSLHNTDTNHAGVWPYAFAKYSGLPDYLTAIEMGAV